MPTVQAWQHIYSNVETEQSPQGRGGFQTLFYTISGLTEEEVSEMEGRLLYFPSEVEPVKRLFFSTSTGKGVVAQIISLSEPDQFGRKGRYLAHSLVFPPETLAQFEADPFRIFRGFDFITTVAEALAQGDFATGNIHPRSLDLPDFSTGAVEAAARWATPELIKLTLLALRVDEQAQQRQAVTFVGEPAQLETALEVAFLGVPTVLRPRCTFDTYFYRCNLVATPYWAIGLPEPQPTIKFAQVDGAARQVQGEVALQPRSVYEHWVVAVIEANRLAEMMRDRETAFALSEWLDDRPFDPAALEAASPGLIADVFEVNPAAVRASVRRRVGELLPPALVERAAGHIHQRTPAFDLYQQLRQGFDLNHLLDILYETYTNEVFQQPPHGEVKALEALLTDVDHPLLRLGLAYWDSPRRKLPRALEQTDEASYRQFGKIALRHNLVEPLGLLVSGRTDAFLDLYLAADVNDLVELVEVLIEQDQPERLSRLTGQIADLERHDLQKLAKVIDKQPAIPPAFQGAVEAAVAALPPQTAVERVFGAIWRRLPGRG